MGLALHRNNRDSLPKLGANMSEDRRLSDDPTRTAILKVADLLPRVDQKLTDHIEWAKEAHQEQSAALKDHDARLKNVEEVHTDIKRAITLGKWVAGGGLSIGGIAAFWDKVHAFFYHKP